MCPFKTVWLLGLLAHYKRYGLLVTLPSPDTLIFKSGLVGCKGMKHDVLFNSSCHVFLPYSFKGIH